MTLALTKINEFINRDQWMSKIMRMDEQNLI